MSLRPDLSARYTPDDLAVVLVPADAPHPLGRAPSAAYSSMTLDRPRLRLSMAAAAHLPPKREPVSPRCSLTPPSLVASSPEEDAAPATPADDAAGHGATSWTLIPYDVPWGEDFVDYRAGVLPGPEGDCLFLRSPTPEEKRRATQACQMCRERKAKCSGARPSCTRCIEKGYVCEYAEEPRRTMQAHRRKAVTYHRHMTRDRKPHMNKTSHSSSARMSPSVDRRRSPPVKREVLKQEEMPASLYPHPDSTPQVALSSSDNHRRGGLSTPPDTKPKNISRLESTGSSGMQNVRPPTQIIAPKPCRRSPPPLFLTSSESKVYPVHSAYDAPHGSYSSSCVDPSYLTSSHDDSYTGTYATYADYSVYNTVDTFSEKSSSSSIEDSSMDVDTVPYDDSSLAVMDYSAPEHSTPPHQGYSSLANALYYS